MELLTTDNNRFASIAQAFRSSYSGMAGSNKFTKVLIDYEADQDLRNFFATEGDRVESWFNVISPETGSLTSLREDLQMLAKKIW